MGVYDSSGTSGMNPKYHDIYRQAEDLRTSFHARLNDPFNPVSISLRRQADQLVSDIQSGRAPQDIEGRLKSIQGGLLRAKDQTDVTVMSDENQAFFNRRYGHMREDVRRMPDQTKPYNQPNRGGTQWL